MLDWWGRLSVMKTNGAQLMGMMPVDIVRISHDVMSFVLHWFRCICDFAPQSRSSNILEAARIINRLKPQSFISRGLASNESWVYQFLWHLQTSASWIQMNLLPSIWLSARVRVPLYNQMGIHTGSAALITCGFVADARSLTVILGCGCQGNFVMYLQPWPKHPSFLLVVASVACLEVKNSLTQNLLAVISLSIAWNWGMLFTFCGLWSQLYCKLHAYSPFGTRGRTYLELWVLHNDKACCHYGGCQKLCCCFFV